ncbi:hypothetical protein VE01_01210 [Pseudogymnoascus verrucosus]|uniref:Glutamine amidotransferase domain-containing protein n=1 Tax=Pseudogymnoascus verrucosus TaxID=342668 RepID=A0A1B8GY77_9PEZI|nr:uncharacterized protein VE01_01210 [Pseudogymnoascus verrucosus]OBU00788.1 hypothetical protein VE01_01210 [Pseudogymnoascus verrucosus]
MEMLQEVSSTIPGWNNSDISYITFDATKGQLPRRQSLDGYDAVVITGSGAGAYDTDSWVLKLVSFVAEIYKDRPDMKLLGSCFGHQVICNAIFKASEDGPAQTDLPPVVSRNPKGWELGIQLVKLSPEFLARFGPVGSNPDSPSEMRLQLVHQDRVNAKSITKAFVRVGQTELCDVQGIYKPGRVFSLQVHPEFNPEIAIECRKPIVEETEFEGIIKNGSGGDDHLYAACAILEFLREEVAEETVAMEEVTEEEVFGKGAV